MTLKQYLSAENLTQSDFIKLCYEKTGHHLPMGTLAKYVSGYRIPRRKEMLIINTTTDNQVQANDFYRG